MKQKEYLQEFPCNKNSASSDSIRAEALKQALDIRKFEIDLYWKRTAYFWAFIALMFTGYFTILIHKKELCDVADELLLLSSCFGMFLSVCWYFVNKGSKYWQENWEKHVDWLEDDVMGPLYKMILKYGKGKSGRFCPTKPYPFSVSKINSLISFVICIIWVYLFLDNVIKILGKFISRASFLCFITHYSILITLILTIFVLAILIFLLSKCCANHDHKESEGKEDEFIKRV